MSQAVQNPEVIGKPRLCLDAGQGALALGALIASTSGKDEIASGVWMRGQDLLGSFIQLILNKILRIKTKIR